MGADWLDLATGTNVWLIIDIRRLVASRVGDGDIHPTAHRVEKRVIVELDQLMRVNVRGHRRLWIRAVDEFGRSIVRIDIICVTLVDVRERNVDERRIEHIAHVGHEDVRCIDVGRPRLGLAAAAMC
ncbi:MAG: hypothetical protein IV100_07940 [Myxococcales bacterium]|nr:hypothetical protein [Myxococcales bacterium]